MKTTQRITASLALIAILITGCQTPIQSQLIEIYKNGSMPTRPYEKIKLLYTVQWPSREVSAMNYFIRKAEILHADAIVVLPHESGGFHIEPFQGHIGMKVRFKALAVKWSDKNNLDPK